MAIHESSINFRKLIQDLADMYPFDVSEVVISELIANALDAKATRIEINYDPERKILSVNDNGAGMSKGQFAEYHDFAAGLKKRGAGIGFAGLGAKISFNLADQVITETKSATFYGGSNWFINSNHKLVWEEIVPQKKTLGTKVAAHFQKNSKISFSDSRSIIEIIKRQYLPLLDINFLRVYDKLDHYSKDLKFIVNGNMVESFAIKEKYQLEKVVDFIPKKSNRAIGCGTFGVSQIEYPMGMNLCGVLLCTHGKVIKSDFFNQFPGAFGTRILGIVEIPEFIEFLTTQKTDFTKKGQFKRFESLMNPIRVEFSNWLKSIGVETKEIVEVDEALKLEREIKKIMDEIPEIAKFFGFWSKKSILSPSIQGDMKSDYQPGIEPSFPFGDGRRHNGAGYPDSGSQDGAALKENIEGGILVKPISRSAKRGPKIGFVEEREKIEMAWVDGNNIQINRGHPVYEKSKANNRSELLFNMFAIACAIQRFKGLDESEKPDFQFIDRMMAAWASK